MEYRELESALRQEAEKVEAAGQSWPAERVAEKLTEIADQLTRIRNQHQGGVNASMGKRSGWSFDI